MNINSTQSSSYTNAAYSSKGFSGMASGIDTESLVQSMLSSIQNKIDKQKQTQQQLTWKQEFYRDIISQVNSFQSKFFDLTSNTSLRLNSFFNSITASSSSSAVSVSANNGASNSEFKVQVARLATATSVTSGAASSEGINVDAKEFAYSRMVNIKVGDGEAVKVDLSGGDQKLSIEDIAQRINDAFGNNSNIAKVETTYFKKGDKETVLTKDENGKYVDKDGNEIDDEDVETSKKLVFSSNNAIQISGSSAGMAILGLSGTAKSTEITDEDGNKTYTLTADKVNENFTKGGQVNGSIDVTLDGVKKSIAIREGQSMEDLQKAVQSAFGNTVKFEQKDGKWSISVDGVGRNLTISANAETMQAIGFEKGTTTVSNQLLRSDKLGKLGIEDEGSFEINGKKIEYSANDTISSIINKVNASGAGVKMSFDSLSNKFKLEATSTGKGFDINITGDDNDLFGKLGFNTEDGGLKKDASYKDGQNALVNINGSTFERANNQFTYNGVNITLKSTTGKYVEGSYESDGSFKTVDGTTDNAAEVKTTRDTSKIVDTLKSFVEEYNNLIEKLNKVTHEKATYKKYPPLTDAQKKEMSEKEIELWEEKAKEGLYRNDSNISRFLNDMRSAMYTRNSSGILLSSIGINSSNNWKDYGKLNIDEDELEKALQTNPEKIQQLFTGENGLGARLNKVCDQLASTSSARPGSLVSIAGVVGKGTENSNEIKSKLDSITKKLDSLNRLYEKRKTRYWKQFNAMETALSNMDSQSSYLSNFTGGY